MRFSVIFSTLVAITGRVNASPVETSLEPRQQSVGDGPYAPAHYVTDNALPRHTIYKSQNGNSGAMPVFIWGNGACSADGTSAQNFLKQIASFGFLAISAGRPGQGGSSTVDWMREAVNWAANGGSSGYNIDPKRIMVGGYSCGGTEAYDFINDDRVASIGIFNSGLLSNYDSARTIRKPVLFALGGPSDIAYGNGERDYSYLPSGTPSWKGNLNRVGHGGTYGEYNGGLYAKAAVKWLQWIFKNDQNAATYFKSNNAAVSDGWSDAVSKSLDQLVPIGGTNPPSTTTSTSAPPTTTTNPPDNGGSCSPKWGQCGGVEWSGPKCCSEGTCQVGNQWYSQCV